MKSMMMCTVCLMQAYRPEVKGISEGRYQVSCDKCSQPALCFSINPQLARPFKLPYSSTRYRRLRDAQLCINCRAPVSHYSMHCDPCHLKLMKKRRAKSGQSPWRPGGRGRRPFVDQEGAGADKQGEAVVG